MFSRCDFKFYMCCFIKVVNDLFNQSTNPSITFTVSNPHIEIKHRWNKPPSVDNFLTNLQEHPGGPNSNPPLDYERRAASKEIHEEQPNYCMDHVVCLVPLL